MNKISDKKIILQVKNLKRSFDDLLVFEDVSFNLYQGEVVALIGESGSGKSTILHSIGLLDVIEKGEIVIDGQDLSHAKDKERTKTRLNSLGFVYQHHNLLGDFNALENVTIPMMLKDPHDPDLQKKAIDILSKLGLKDRLKHKPGELSGGERQRVAIARALANSPKILLADEPTGNLDPATSENVFTILKNIVRGTQQTTFFVTHNIKLAGYADRILQLKDKKITELSKDILNTMTF